MLNRSKMWAASLVLATFVAGGAVGSVISNAWGDSDAPREGREERGRRPSYSERLAEALQLSPAQQESVKVILERRQEGLAQIWRETQPRWDSLRVVIREDILRQLEEEQSATYHGMIARSDSARVARDQANRERNRDGGRRRDW